MVAAPVKLNQTVPDKVGSNGGDGNCYNTYDTLNARYGGYPAYNYTLSATLDGRPYSTINAGREVYAAVNYKSKLVVTETAVRANDYFVVDGSHVSSVTYTLKGPATVPDPSYCMDASPYYVGPSNFTYTTAQPVVIDVLAKVKDADNSVSQLKLSKVSTLNGIGSAQIVTLANGRQAIKLTPDTPHHPGWDEYYYVDLRCLTQPANQQRTKLALPTIFSNLPPTFNDH